MSEKREFPILNGKLLSDLDLNGHKLLGLNIPEGGGGGGGASVTVDDTLTKDGENPVKSKGIWSAIWGAISAPAASVYAWVTAELKKKQDSLSDTQLAAVDSGITAAKVEKLDGVEAGAQKNPDLTPYAKKDDLRDYAKGGNVLPRYQFVNAEVEYSYSNESDDLDAADVYIKPFAVNYIEVTKQIANGCYFLFFSDGNIASDAILVVDAKEDIANSYVFTFVAYPRGGDAANLEVVAGKRNVFFITEVQSNQFMVARDELALPDAGGGEA